MIITRTPFRISFFGGGTDYPAWYREHGGAVVSTAIDKYCYITCRYLPPFFDHRSRILYSKVETVDSNSRIEHPAVRGILAHLGIEDGVEIHHDGDLPAQTGLGSSSAFAVGLLHALYALTNKMTTKMDLAKQAIYIEQEVLKEYVGCQDQVITAIGGLQRIDFFPTGDIQATPVPIGQDRIDTLQSHLLLYFTGFSRIGSLIIREQLERMREKIRELSRLRVMVDESLRILTSKGSLDDFGRLLDESWSLKRGLSSKVSSPAIDDIYETAKSAGALGGKLLGAGGGGFMVLFAPPERHACIQKKLGNLLRIPFRFERDGSHIILYQPNSVPA